MRMRPEMKRYTLGILIAMSLYVVTLVGVNWWFRYAPPTGLLAYVAAALPALPIMAVFAIIGRLIVELRDEFVRMLFIRQTLIATGFMLSVTTIWGFLEGFHLVPHAQGFYAATLWFAGLGVVGCVNWLIERRKDA